LNQLSEWTKHIVTIASAILVLSVTILKDVASVGSPMLAVGAIGALLISFAFLLLAVWKALRFVRSAASAILSTGAQLARGDELKDLKDLLTWTQRFFLIGLVSFAVFSLLALASWVAAPRSPGGTVPAEVRAASADSRRPRPLGGPHGK